MKFCVDRTLLGTDRNLVVDDGFSWCNFVPDRTWHLTGFIKPKNDWCLDSLLKLEGKQIDVSPPKRFCVAMESLLPGSNVPWQKVMPHAEHRAFTKNIVTAVGGLLNSIDTNYYMGTWVPGNVALRSLQRTKVDRSMWESIMNSKAGNKHIVATFEPDVDGFAEVPTYDRFGTLTGRLTIDSGPNILTLKREFRSILRSSFIDGKVMMVDFAALEARVLLYEASKRCDDSDLYGMIARDMGNVGRDDVKAAVICELYGSSKYMLGKKLNLEGKKLNAFFDNIKSYFNTHVLLDRIKGQFINTGSLTNRYGRKVLVDEPLDYVMLNYYAQSTGADVSIVGFSSIAEKLLQHGVRPLYLLHDAMFVDVPKESIDIVNELRTVKVKGYVQPYYLKVSTLDCTQLTIDVDLEHDADCIPDA